MVYNYGMYCLMHPIVAQTQLAMTFVPSIFKTLQHIVYFTILKMHTKGYKQGDTLVQQHDTYDF